MKLLFGLNTKYKIFIGTKNVFKPKFSFSLQLQLKFFSTMYNYNFLKRREL
jgi:hypothetical protein